jgi:hypothetical protein
LCTDAPDLADSTEGIGFPGCAHSAAKPIPRNTRVIRGAPFVAVISRKAAGVEDRIYRSLRTAQERELQSHPSPAAPNPAAAASAPATEALVAHVAPSSHVNPPSSDPAAFRWFARGFGADRPRISIVGTLSLSVLISAGLFAAQMIVKPRHKRSGAEQNVAADSTGAMRLAAHPADDADDSSGPVSVSSRFQHVHAPATRAKSHPTHTVALAEQPAAEDNIAKDSTADDSSGASNSAPAVKTHRHASASRSVQHAADEGDISRLDDEGPSQAVDRSAPAPSAASNQSVSNRDGAGHAAPTPVGPSPVPETAAAPSDHLTVQPNVGIAAGQPGFQATAQPAVPTSAAPSDSASSRWPIVPSAAVSAPPAVSGTVQVSAEASNANAPTLTIVPGRPDSIAATLAAQAGRVPTLSQQPAADPIVNRPMDSPAARPSQPPSVNGLFQDRQDIMPAAAPAQTPPAQAYAAQPIAAQSPANSLETLDRTKVMSFQFRNAPWTLVLAKFANATGLELRMQALPDGTFNRWDSARYTPTQTLTILNAELAKLGCQAKVVGTALCVVAMSPGDPTIPASGVVPASVPATPSSAQLPQYPGVPVSGTAASGAR